MVKKKRKKKDRIDPSSGLNISQLYREPFKFQHGYNYYQDPVYEPYNNYFEGFGSRQLEKMMYGFNQLALSFEAFKGLMGNRVRNLQEIPEEEKVVLKNFEDIYDIAFKINEVIRSFNRTDRFGKVYGGELFGDFYDKEMHGRKWVRPADELATGKFVRFIDEHGEKWRTGPTEEYYPEDSRHISSLNSSIDSFYMAGIWYEYLKVSMLESGCDFISEEANEFNVGIIEDLYVEANKLMGNLRKLEYLDSLEFFEEKNVITLG